MGPGLESLMVVVSALSKNDDTSMGITTGGEQGREKIRYK